MSYLAGEWSDDDGDFAGDAPASFSALQMRAGRRARAAIFLSMVVASSSIFGGWSHDMAVLLNLEDGVERPLGTFF
jgi:anti-sigma factor RsiW